MSRQNHRRVAPPDVTAAERLWAMGELREGHPGYCEVVFFAMPRRLRQVWAAVHGEPIDLELARQGMTGGLIFGALVSRLATNTEVIQGEF